MKHSTIVPKPAPSLAQARRSRSGEGDPLAQAGPFSPRRELEEWDSSFCDLSLKNANSSSERQFKQKILGEPLLVSPRQDTLAWARKIVLTIVLACSRHIFRPNNV